MSDIQIPIFTTVHLYTILKFKIKLTCETNTVKLIHVIL